MEAPKVFVSHASEDKARFVIPFATRLRQNGVDAWVDQWEMNLGDSLVDKIFEEGLKNAAAVIVVLSRISVQKPWVREELNASIVNKIQRSCRIIPVVIDDCDVPAALQSTVWQKINDLENYDAEFNRILKSIYGESDRPPLGSPPAFTRAQTLTLPNLTKSDSIVFKAACEAAIQHGHYMVQPLDIAPICERFGIKRDEQDECLEILNGRGYIKAQYVLSGNITTFNITLHGFTEYAQVCIPDYAELQKQVAFAIVNQNMADHKEIAVRLNQPNFIVEVLLDTFESRNWLKVTKYLGGEIVVHRHGPELTRWLRSISS